MSVPRVTQDCDERVRAIIASVRRIPVETVMLDSSLADLGVDSLESLTLIFELEEAFNIEVPTETLERSMTIRSLIDQLAPLLSVREAASGT